MTTLLRLIVVVVALGLLANLARRPRRDDPLAALGRCVERARSER